jgi:hypothetical protein
VVEQPTEPSEIVVAQPTPAPAPTQPAQPVVPQAQQPTAYVELNPGARSTMSRTARRRPAVAQSDPQRNHADGDRRTGTALVPETGQPTPEPTPVVEALEELWLSVQWNPPSGGYLRCWVNAQYLRIEFKGKLLDTLEELWELPKNPSTGPAKSWARMWPRRRRCLMP